MLSIIHYFKSPTNRLLYNERKVERGDAQLILAANFLELHGLDHRAKLEHLMYLNACSAAVKRNTAHISLNFSPEDQLDSPKMAAIARSYMKRLGFGDQPYLVYRHFDSGHPHCHILTSLVRANGMHIEVDFQFVRQSEPARKSIEREFGLVVQRRRSREEIENLPVLKASASLQYGKGETIRNIAIVVDDVLANYNIVSMEQFNAVLRLYNIMADTGSQHSRTFQAGGLQYQVIDARGNRKGRPFKASRIYSRPTLEKLQQVFERNAALRDKPRQRMLTWLNYALRCQPATMKSFIHELRKEGIRPVFPRNAFAMDDPVFYVDHRMHSVFSDRELGAPFGNNALREKFELVPDEFFPILKKAEEMKQDLRPGVWLDMLRRQRESRQEEIQDRRQRRSFGS